ncbi:DUF4331 family protein [Pseudenhygromyxa sp. WMMC2535]|uniref:DUF4331 family protein n=1 Tax=Pseudenhygromyxa sp. WMMC2535 TaxID=2712867 RepID=UPI0015538192|nr:DUF4331 family protein [Pseudenhygromyxa sp. WMMC2535]NVB39351.1 DUF4331 family protein [Pseudenhygromyxa sp. WMMC2535]
MFALSLSHTAQGADHTDSPAAAADSAVDLADFYAWHTESDHLVLAVNFAGLASPGADATYDAEALYGFHVDRDQDGVSDHDIWIRFGQNGAGEWGVQVSGLPGEDPLVGPVDTVLTSDAGSMAFAGPREDPFFFDFEGFLATLDTETLAFDPTRDSFAGTNVTSIVIETGLDGVADGSTNIDVWATAARKG